VSHPLLHSAISSSPVIAGFNSQLPGVDLPPDSFELLAELAEAREGLLVVDGILGDFPDLGDRLREAALAPLERTVDSLGATRRS